MTPDQSYFAMIEILILKIVFLSAFVGYIAGAATFDFVQYWVDLAMRWMRRAAFRAKRQP